MDDIGRRSAKNSRRRGGDQGQTAQTHRFGKLFGGRRRANRADAAGEDRQNGDAGDRSLRGAAGDQLKHRDRKNDAGETKAQQDRLAPGEIGQPAKAWRHRNDDQRRDAGKLKRLSLIAPQAVARNEGT